jgi:hypothetical protein
VKLGDKVLISGNQMGSVNSKGDYGIVTEIYGTSIRVKVEGNGSAANWSHIVDLKIGVKATKLAKKMYPNEIEKEGWLFV